VQDKRRAEFGRLSALGWKMSSLTTFSLKRTDGATYEYPCNKDQCISTVLHISEVHKQILILWNFAAMIFIKIFTAMRTSNLMKNRNSNNKGNMLMKKCILQGWYLICFHFRFHIQAQSSFWQSQNMRLIWSLEISYSKIFSNPF
jgi:hypothetical protein